MFILSFKNSEESGNFGCSFLLNCESRCHSSSTHSRTQFITCQNRLGWGSRGGMIFPANIRCKTLTLCYKLWLLVMLWWITSCATDKGMTQRLNTHSNILSQCCKSSLYDMVSHYLVITTDGMLEDRGPFLVVLP